MDDVAARTESAPGRSAAARVAGVLLVLLGVMNLVLAGIALWTTMIRLSTATAVALGVLGLVTVVLGVFVARRRRWALVVSLVIFGVLFLVQAFAATGGGTAPALITLAVVLVPIVLALRADRAR